MLKKRTLAFRNPDAGKPQVRKELFFATLLTITAACTPAQALPNGKPQAKLQQTRTKLMPWPGKSFIDEPERLDCKDTREFLTTEEIRESVCKKDYVFALTDNAIVIVPRRKLSEFSEGKLILFSHEKIEVEEIGTVGVADWTTSEDTVYLLTLDGVLTVAPAGEKSRGYKLKEWLDGANVPFDIKNTRVAYYSGFLMVKGEKDIIAISFSDGLDGSAIRIPPSKLTSGDFFKKEGKFFFGTEKEKFEIVTDGPNPRNAYIR